MKVVTSMTRNLSNISPIGGVDPIDAEVGKRIRYRRWFLGMTQVELGKLVGVQFQQIQKYEIAANRVSASRLWKLSKALDVEINFFFPSEQESNDVNVIRADNTHSPIQAELAQPQRKYAQR